MIDIQNFITTYMLKTCLLKLFIVQSESGETDRANIPNCQYEWTKAIYERFREELRNKHMESWHSKFEVIFSCKQCKEEHACCLKRKVREALALAILEWLDDNKDFVSSLDIY